MPEADEAAITGWAMAAKAGDRQAAARFIRATQPQVRRLLAHLVSGREADDLTQETYLRALRSLPRFAGRSSVRTWLYTIARRVAADHLRAVASRPRTADLADWESAAESAPAVAGSAGRFEEQVVLRRLLADLPEERRLAFVVTQVLGLSYAEAAEVCDCPIGTVRSRVARARDELVAALREHRAGAPEKPSGEQPTRRDRFRPAS